MVAITSTLRAAAAPLRATRRSTIRVGASRRVSVVRAFRDDEIKEAGKDVVDTVSTTANEIVDKVAAYWEASEEKPHSRRCWLRCYLGPLLCQHRRHCRRPLALVLYCL
ncbi:hypothetical protein Ndes2437B_g00217 [Nannochloris sp. 'desiccata']